jgi:hypothetical protein
MSLVLTLQRSSLYTSVSKPVIPAGIAGIQATRMYLSSPSMALDTRFPAGMTILLTNLTK